MLEYEVKFVGMHERDNKYLTKQELEDMVNLDYLYILYVFCWGKGE